MEYPKLWKITAEDKQFWFSAETSLPGENFEAYVRRDGCVELSKHYVSGEIEHMHICDLDALLARLQWLKFMAIEQFGGEWPQ
mgnify:FL=1